MKMTIKDIMRPAFCLLAVALLFSLGGCGDKKFSWNHPLAVSQHNLTVSVDGGATHILVYSTGDWTVGFDRDINWGSLDRRSGYGNGEFVFSYNANYGISRKVTVLLASGSLRDSILITQGGVLSSITLEFTNSSLSVADTAATITAGLSTNLLFAENDFNSRVVYYDEDGNEGDVSPWISNIVISAEAVSFDVERNMRDIYRVADLTVYVEDADDNEYAATLAVTQIPAGMAGR